MTEKWPVIRKSIHRSRGTKTFLSKIYIAFAAILVAVIGYVAIVTMGPIQLDSLSSPPEITSSEITTLYLDGDFSPQFAGEMMAERLGFFQQNDIKIRLKPEPGKADFTAQVVLNRAIGVTSGQKFLLARWRGEPIVAFGSSLLDTTTTIYTQQRSGLRYPKDLVGKRLSYQPGSEDAVVLESLLARLGLPRSQIQNLPVPDKLNALKRGEVDAVVASIGDQLIPSDDEATRLNVIRPQDYGIHIPGLVYFASADLIRDRSSVVLQTLRAVISGWQEVYDDLDKSVPLIVAFDSGRLTPAGMRFGLLQQRDLVRPTGMRIGDFDESRWKMLRDILLFARVGEQTESLSAAMTYEFLREVYRKPLNSGRARGGAFGN